MPLRTCEDGFPPQQHLRALESEDHGDLTALNSAEEAGETLFKRNFDVEKALRRQKVMFFKEVLHMFSNSALFMKYDKEVEI